MTNPIAQTLEQHFDVAFTAPNGIKKLRELILTLAMQGKLVPQDPNDTPASQLLKDIASEKERLVSEGKIKKQKPLPAISDDEKPYELPQGWEWVRFANIYYAIGSKSNQLQTSAYKDFGCFPIVDQGKKFIAGYTENEEALLKINSPVIVFGDHTKVIKLIDFNFVIGADGVKVLQPFSVITTKYVYYFMNSLKLYDRGYARHFKILNDNLIPLPPLAEQQRIVAKIDQLMTRCDALEALQQAKEAQRLNVHQAAIRQLLDAEHTHTAWQFLQTHFAELYSVKDNVSELRKAILQLAVMGKLVPQDPKDAPASELLKDIANEKERLVSEGKIKKKKPLPAISNDEKPYDLPQGWEWVRMDDLCNEITAGSTPPQPVFNDVEGVPFLKVYNIRNQFIDFNYKKKFIDSSSHKKKMKRSFLFPGDVIMNIVGPPLGKTAIIPDDYPEYNCNQAIVLFRLNNIKMNKYVYSYLLAGTFLDRIELIGTAGQDNISITKSKIMPIPLPPLAEQHRIVAKIDQLMSLCDNLEQQIDASQAKQSELLAAVMSGV